MIKNKIPALLFCFISLPILIQACATITVNVYFPAEEVREAYISLEEELLRPQGGEGPASGPPVKKESVPEPQSLRTYPEKPLLKYRRFLTLKRKFSLDLSKLALAQDNLAREITNKIRNMPEVVGAFKSRGARLNEIGKMLSDRKVGEGNKGLLVVLGDLTGQERDVFNAENKDRMKIIDGMARAIVEINGIEPSSENINRVAPEAGAQFAAVRRSEAEPGWAIQLPNGSWVTKK
ncbi:MAG: DUF1318 domain-containing protein [Deltaproteobacteria bacterium]|nr:DUF1318 domain-containing protein [Deltaproteobacteria bacterium]